MGRDETPGARLRRLRLANGWAQAEVAERADVSAAYLSQLELGRRPMTSAVAARLRPVVLAVARGDGPVAAEARELLADLDARIGSRRRVAVGTAGDIGPVGLLPPGETRQLPLEALGDEDGRLWVDPAAVAEPVVVDSGRPRVRRGPDGELSVDIGRLLGSDVGDREPTRHFIPARPVYALEGDRPPYEEYVETRIEVELEGERYVVQVDEGATGFPPDAAVVHIVTAENPWPEVLSTTENAERTERLRVEVASGLGAQGVRWGEARTSAAPTDIGEDGVALIDVPRADVLALAERHGQSSIFEWTRERLTVVLVDGDVISRPVRAPECPHRER